MEPLIRISRISYGIMMGALAVQQLFYATFRPVIVPPINFPGITPVIYLVSLVVIAASMAIIFDRNARLISLLMGGFFLALTVFCQVPFEILADPYYHSLGAWTSANKDLVFAGGGFIVAGSYPVGANDSEPAFISFLEKLIPYGSVFMCITMICFGIDHFLYVKGVSGLVPTWIPGAIFWTYFAGAALILSGVTIILKIKLKLSALLLALMIFLWLLMLHIPRAVVDPYSLQGNEVSSVFEAFGFSGLAYLIACGYYKRPVFRPAEAQVAETSLSGSHKLS